MLNSRIQTNPFPSGRAPTGTVKPARFGPVPSYWKDDLPPGVADAVLRKRFTEPQRRQWKVDRNKQMLERYRVPGAASPLKGEVIATVSREFATNLSLSGNCTDADAQAFISREWDWLVGNAFFTVTMCGTTYAIQYVD